MKKQITFTTILLLCVLMQTFGQAPQSFKYQTIARDNTGNIIANKKVSFEMSILQGSVSGPVSYEETDTATTNQFGLANLSIGMGTMVSGTMAGINWGNGPYFIKIEFDPNGGNNFTLMGISQMLSVPYALYSQSTGDTTMWKKNAPYIYYKSGVAIGGAIGNYPGVNLQINNGSIYDGNTNGGSLTLADPGWGVQIQDTVLGGHSSMLFSCQGQNYMAITGAYGNVGIGTNAPTSKLQVVGLPVYANNAAAVSGGLTVGAFYRIGADPDVVCVVH